MERGVSVLIVDDEADIRETISVYFEAKGVSTHAAASGEEMRATLAAHDIDVVILDLRLGKEDGLELCRELQSQPDLGVIMLTGSADTIDRVVGLEVGADDYIAKPFELREVLARVKSLARRLNRTGGGSAPASTPDPTTTLALGTFRLNVEARTLTSADGALVPLSVAEFDLLKVFAERPGRVLSRDQLLDLAGVVYTDPYDRAIDVRIARLRKKIEADPAEPKLIRTIRGAGYVFSPAG